MNEQEVIGLLKADDDTIRVKMDEYQLEELQALVEKLAEPVKLSFTQRAMARAFMIDVPTEQNRLTRLAKEAIELKATNRSLALDQHDEESALCVQNLM